MAVSKKATVFVFLIVLLLIAAVLLAKIIFSSNVGGDCNHKTIGDGICDYLNNNPSCDFDGNDCCTDVLTACSQCRCFFDEVTSQSQITQAQTEENSFTTTITTQNCPKPEWVGDHHCDDVTNSAWCNFDGGDCCGNDRNVNYCNQCICHSVFIPISTAMITTSTQQPIFECFQLDLVGDGFCDDDTNTESCSYDGGDCCGQNVIETYCIQCVCNYDCEKPEWVGDGFCDDVTNTANCKYDGGDCCKTVVNKDYCDICFCFASLTIPPILSECQGIELIGDGLCDDAVNNGACILDGGDCCHPQSSLQCILNYCLCQRAPFE